MKFNKQAKKDDRRLAALPPEEYAALADRALALVPEALREKVRRMGPEGSAVLRSIMAQILRVAPTEDPMIKTEVDLFVAADDFMNGMGGET